MSFQKWVGTPRIPSDCAGFVTGDAFFVPAYPRVDVGWHVYQVAHRRHQGPEGVGGREGSLWVWRELHQVAVQVSKRWVLVAASELECCFDALLDEERVLVGWGDGQLAVRNLLTIASEWIARVFFLST